MWGWSPYEDYRQAAQAAGARPVNERPPAPVEAIERFGRCTTRELEVICDGPAPVIRAELWGAAREWRLRPVSVLGGTFWELA